MAMAPFLVFAIAMFTGFLGLLAGLAFLGYRVSARREGPALGPAGGCALTAVLLGAGAFATTAFIVLLGIVYASQAHHHDQDETDSFSEPAHTSEIEESPSEPEHSDEVKPADEDKSDGVRQY